ncbi:MAG: hypothetical protein FWF18_00715 [Dehalococcoidia bacterium]|nr:hypothetical protein [Dehalococcoidia bacterium]
MMEKVFTIEQATEVAAKIGMNFDKWDVAEFCLGMNVELEHGKADANTNITDDDPVVTGRLVWAHLNKIPDFYTRLGVMKEGIGAGE